MYIVSIACFSRNNDQSKYSTRCIMFSQQQYIETHLTCRNLANNALTGTIPSSISTLAPDPGYAAPTMFVTISFFVVVVVVVVVVTNFASRHL